MILTTLCYLEKNDQYLMLHRVKKKKDENAGKWIGVGGHIENGESPESCVRREVFEETGLVPVSFLFRGVVDFYSDTWDDERMFLFTADDFSGDFHECDEGILKWIPKKDLSGLNLWEGDRIFLDYLQNDFPFFHLELHYEGDILKSSKLHPRVILASQSPRRLQLLEQIGIFPEVIPSGADEETKASKPDEIVKELSRKKAESVLERIPFDGTHSGEDPRRIYVIGSDTVVSLRHEVLGKPRSHGEAASMIRELEGKTHQVYTGVTIFKLERGNDNIYEMTGHITFSDMTCVHVASMTEEEIRKYALSDEPMDKAGGYGIQGTFAAFIEGIEGDYNTVVGLPAGHVYRVIRDMEQTAEEGSA